MSEPARIYTHRIFWRCFSTLWHGCTGRPGMGGLPPPPPWRRTKKSSFGAFGTEGTFRLKVGTLRNTEGRGSDLPTAEMRWGGSPLSTHGVSGIPAQPMVGATVGLPTPTAPANWWPSFTAAWLPLCGALRPLPHRWGPQAWPWWARGRCCRAGQGWATNPGVGGGGQGRLYSRASFWIPFFLCTVCNTYYTQAFMYACTIRENVYVYRRT